MFSTDEMIKRFCINVNWEAKQLEKKDLRDKIDIFLKTGNFTIRIEDEAMTEKGTNTTYRVDYDRCFFDNFNLTCGDINDVLLEYKDIGYRCCLCNSSSDDAVIPDISIQFQIFIRVYKDSNRIPIPAEEKYNYILPSSCETIKI